MSGRRWKLSESPLNRDEQNPQWKGDAVGYTALHDWVIRRLPKPERCSCGSTATLDLANISNTYKRDLSDWVWLCRKCHMLSDGRLQQLRAFNYRSLGKIRGIKGRRCASKYKGVIWDRAHKRWKARFKLHGKQYWIGTYRDEEDAAIAYNVAMQLFDIPDPFLNPV